MSVAVSLFLNMLAIVIIIFMVILLGKAATQYRQEKAGIEEWEERGWSDDDLKKLRDD